MISGSLAAPALHFFWWVVQFCLASLPLKVSPHLQAKKTTQQFLAWAVREGEERRRAAQMHASRRVITRGWEVQALRCAYMRSRSPCGT